MNENEILSLVKLLEDPDENVFNAIKSKVMQNPDLIAPLLENFWVKSDNILANTRAESIINEIYFSNIIKEVKKWKNSDSRDLLNGLLIIEKFFDKTIETQEFEKQVNALINKIWLELNNQLTALEKIKVINHALYKNNQLKYSQKNTKANRYSQITNLFNIKEFNDKSIGLVYSIIAQKLNIPLFILNFDLAQFLVLGYIDESLAKAVFNKMDNSVVFYVMPSFFGEIWSQKQLLLFCETHKISITNKSLMSVKPLSDSEILKKWIDFKLSFYKDIDINYVEYLKKVI